MRSRAVGYISIGVSVFAQVCSLSAAPAVQGVHVLEHSIVYSNASFYSSFPSIVKRPNGDLLTAFRRAPDRRLFGEKGTTHTDPNSYLVLVRSRDSGRTWTAEPELIYANPLGGSQDPCMVQLSDNSIVCSSYGWALMHPDTVAKMKEVHRHSNFVFLGGYLLRSEDGSKWEGPIYPPVLEGTSTLGPYGKPVPAFNRGAMCQGREGKLYWVVVKTDSPHPSETHLLASKDGGRNWSYCCPVAVDPKITFSETSLYETPKGDLVAFMRTANFDDHTVVARSKDQGKSFQKWEDAGFQGHPHYALRLPDKRVLLVYGYRHAPFGIRARVLDSECTNPGSAPELVLREDGGNGDLGYPWATLLSNDRALVVYYFNQQDGTRYIAGTFVALE